MVARGKKATFKNAFAMAVLILLALPFAFYAVQKGLSLASAVERATSRFFDASAPLSSYAIYAHMVMGGIITALAPLQMVNLIRLRVPVLHRFIGRLVAVLAGVTGVAGLVYIVVIGTIGGWWMDLGFGLYGVLMLICAVKTLRLARARHADHPLWAIRLVILVLASWLYRVHYGVWEILTGGVGSNATFNGPFDLVQVFAFYVPYLVVYEIARAKK